VKLKLKEDPREWQKFTSVMMLLGVLVSWMIWRKGVVPREVFLGLFGLWIGVALLAWVWAKPFRGFYRGGMTVSFHVGQVIGAVMLTLFFLVVMTPLGLVLRLLGKDLLKLKRQSGATSYWTEAKTNNDFDRQF